jgi:hypothetical protein
MKNYFPIVVFFMVCILTSCAQKLDKVYILTKEIEKQLVALRNKDKFSQEGWAQRGLIPSPPSVIFNMNNAIHTAIDKIIDSKEELTESKIKMIIRKELYKVKMMDTEEREFIGDTFFELALILKIDCKEELNDFMY